MSAVELRSKSSGVRESFLYFLRLGVLGFGGPLAVVAAVQNDLVEKEKWISRAEFDEAIALIKAMPGPLATQTAIYMGYRRGGRWGGVLAGVGMVIPAFVLVIVCGSFLQKNQNSPDLQAAMSGLQAAAVGVIIASLKPLAQSYWRKSKFWIFLVFGFCLMIYFPRWEPLLILGAGGMSVALARWGFARISAVFPFWFLSSEENAQQMTLILTCLKAGALVFGTGLAIVPMLESDFVGHLHWLTHSEFMNALAIGQVTPGPVLISTSYIGYKVAGILGAFTATVAIFAPSFFNMLTWFPRAVTFLSRQRFLPEFLIGAIGCVVGSILWTTLKLSFIFRDDYLLLVIIVGGALGLYFRKLPTWALILLGGALSALRFYIFR